LYQKGLGVKQNTKKAEALLKQAEVSGYGSKNYNHQ